MKYFSTPLPKFPTGVSLWENLTFARNSRIINVDRKKHGRLIALRDEVEQRQQRNTTMNLLDGLPYLFRSPFRRYSHTMAGYNRLKLDFSLSTNTERAEFLERYLA
jgi:hypothetical protein